MSEIAAGDTVGWVDRANSDELEVIAVDGEYAWVKPPDGPPFTAQKKHLTKVGWKAYAYYTRIDDNHTQRFLVTYVFKDGSALLVWDYSSGVQNYTRVPAANLKNYREASS